MLVSYINKQRFIHFAFILLLLLTTFTSYIFSTTILTADLYQQPIFVSQFATNMVYNALDIVSQFVHNSFPTSHTKLPTTQQFMTTTSLNKTRIIPLMAQPFEVINVTTDNTGGTTNVTKPPDKPNG